MNRYLPFLVSLILSLNTFSQSRVYSVANAHSHNDYEQQRPFRAAYQAGFGSIEADIFLVDSVLIVAHDSSELFRKISLENEYLLPLLRCLKANGGYPYANHNRQLQMLIDIKTDSTKTLYVLIELLNKYPALIKRRNISHSASGLSRSLLWTISGNRPAPERFIDYPDFISFDGVAGRQYSPEALSRISMMSDNFKSYSQWNGKGVLPLQDSLTLRTAVNKAHKLKKPIRFWNAPDIPAAWSIFEKLRADFINTDQIQALADFLSGNKKQY